MINNGVNHNFRDFKLQVVDLDDGSVSDDIPESIKWYDGTFSVVVEALDETDVGFY